MGESVIYQEIESAAVAKGKAEEALAIVSLILEERLGIILPTLESRIQNLSLTQLEELVKASLNFSQESDLANWLDAHR